MRPGSAREPAAGAGMQTASAAGLPRMAVVGLWAGRLIAPLRDVAERRASPRRMRV